jgi:hypothetical protein
MIDENKMCETLLKILNSYENLIYNFDENIEDWDDFGLESSCRMCKAMNVETYGSSECNICPLSTGLALCLTATWNLFFDALQEYSNFMYITTVFDSKTVKRKHVIEKRVIKLAKDRYNEIVKIIKKNGYKVLY